MVAEGAKYNTLALLSYFREHQHRLGFELRVTTLGHVQRGGAPGAYDRILATQIGAAAVEHLAKGEQGLLVGLLKGEIKATPLAEVVAKKKTIDLRLMDLARVLAK